MKLQLQISNRHQASFSSLATGGTDVGSPGCLLIWINLSFELRYVCQFPESLILVVWKWSLDTHKITVFRCQMIAYVNDISPNHHRNTLCLYKKVWIEEGPRKEMLPCTRLRSPFFFLLVNEELPELKLVTQKNSDQFEFSLRDLCSYLWVLIRFCGREDNSLLSRKWGFFQAVCTDFLFCVIQECFTVSTAEPKKACELLVPWGMPILDRMIN